MSESTSEKRRSSTAVILVVTVAVLALLTAAGMWVWKNVSGVGSDSESQSKTYDQTIKTLTLVGDSGDVTISASDSDEVVVDRSLEWTDKKPVSKETVSGDALRIKLDGCDTTLNLGFEHCQISYDIQLPADVVLDIQVDSGNIATRGVTANQTLFTDSGDITADKSGGEVDATTDSGDISLNGAEGVVTARSDSGSIMGTKLNSATFEGTTDSGDVTLEFTAAPESVDINADSGDIEVGVPDDGESYRINSSTDSGDEDITVETSSKADHEIKVEADSGNLTVEYK